MRTTGTVSCLFLSVASLFVALAAVAQELPESSRPPAEAVASFDPLGTAAWTTPTPEAKPASLSWRVTARDGCSTTRQATELVTNAVTGTVTEKPHRYVEVASGLNYLYEAGQWAESQDLIELATDGGAAAVRGPTKVHFQPNLNTEGAITLITRSNRVFRTHPLALAYYDASSGKSVVISRLKDCTGELLPPNQIVYRSVFAELEGDVRFTYTKAAFECDVILRSQPPPPEQYGLEPKTTRLEVWHEWLGVPAPRLTHRLLAREADANARSRMTEPDLTDQILNFGDAWFPTGGAYSCDDSTARSPSVAAQVRVPNLAREPEKLAVAKTWLTTPRRAFLSEAVRWPEVQAKLQSLPLAPRSAFAVAAQERVVCLSQLPAPTSAKTSAAIEVARSEYRPVGLLLDYITVDGYEDYTFAANTTYLVGATYFQGTVTIEPNAILKYHDWGRLLCYGSFNIQGNGTPAILTSKDEDYIAGWPVGDRIDGQYASTGCPSYSAEAAIWSYFQSGPVNINGVRIRWARTAVLLDANPDPNDPYGCSGLTHTIWDSGIELSETGIYLNNGTCDIGGSYYTWQCGVQTPTAVSSWPEGCSQFTGGFLASGGCSSSQPMVDPVTTQVCRNQLEWITLVGHTSCGEPLSAATFSIVAPPAYGQLGPIGPVFTLPNGLTGARVTYLGDPGTCGLDSFQYQVNDGFQDSPPATVTIQAGKKPLANPVTVATCKNTTLNFTLTGSDPCGGALTFALVGIAPPNAQSFNLSPNGAVSYTPDPDYCGSDSFEFKVTNGCQESNPATVSITVGKKPSANSVTVATCRNTTLNFTLTGTDPCGAAPTYALVSGPNHYQSFSLSPNGAVSYTPAVGYTGQDSFVFKVLGDCEDSDQATVTIQVDQTPEAHCQDVMVKKGESITFNLTGFGGAPLTFALVPNSGPDHAQSFSLSANGSVTYQPQSGYDSVNGPDGFDFTVSSCGQVSGQAHVTINVVPGPTLTTECRPQSIVLNWTVPEWIEQRGLIQEFQIFRCDIGSGSCTPVNLLATVADPNARTFTDTGVQPNRVYCYRVRFRHRNTCYPLSTPEFWESPYSSTECRSTCCPPSNGPFWTDYGGTAEQLAQWILGPGFTVNNATYTGAAVARGTFGNGTAAGLPINTGVILSSGDIARARGPNNSSSATKINGEPADTDLSNLVGFQTADASVLSFDIVSPSATNILFEYVFASEEYLEFVGSEFDDPVAIFVDGLNIALVPGFSDRVSVNTINPGAHAQFYQNNPPPPGTPLFNLQYDGLTINLTAQVQISASVPRRVKIAIADSTDLRLDSSVFIRAGIPCP